jgi:ATP/ADP translocase
LIQLPASRLFFSVLYSMIASSMAHLLRLPGLLVVAAMLLEISAELSIELGRIMQKHWEEQQLFQSSNDLNSLDSSMKRSSSMGSMKRVASGNSLNRIQSTSDLPLSPSRSTAAVPEEKVNDNTFVQRLLRGVTTILRSRLLMAIFTYNALYASTTVLLSFQRAALVANRRSTTTTEADMAFLANVNMASSVAVFALQASGLGASLAHACGPRKTLALMPLIRLLGVLALAWWHQTSNGQAPNLIVFLIVDEATKIMNLAVAKPVRESLWRGLSNEARYEAKPIVDTLANRWGGGSAAFLVSFINKTLDLFGVVPDSDGVRMIFGFPPILFLCMIIAAWWTVVSFDLGQIRRRIDMELKKMQ